MSLCWDPFMKEICKELGFEWKSAVVYAKNGSDHYKLRDLLEITYIVFTSELLLYFMKSCVSTNVSPTVNDYWNFCSELKILNCACPAIGMLVFACLNDSP